MASTNSRDLTLTTVDNNTTVEVKYNAVFTPFERFLAANGLRFQEVISIIGADPDGGTAGTLIRNFAAQVLPVTPGAVAQTIPRTRSLRVARSVLQEDAGLGDNDSIVCRIVIRPLGLPVALTAFTDNEVLVG
jgi:hypothetical protein